MRRSSPRRQRRCCSPRWSRCSRPGWAFAPWCSGAGPGHRIQNEACGSRRPASTAGGPHGPDDGRPGRRLLNSLIVTSISVAATMVLAASAAWGYSRWRFSGKQAGLSLCIAPMVIPPVVLLVPLFQPGAYLHQISTFQVVIVIYTGLMLPFSIYLLASFFSQIPESLVEAAIVDGASSWTVFRRVVLPLSGPPLITLGVVNLLWAWNELLIALVFLQSDTKKTLMVGISEFQSKFNLNIPVTMAGLSIAVLPLVAAYIFGQRYFIRGLTAGALRE